MQSRQNETPQTLNNWGEELIREEGKKAILEQRVRQLGRWNNKLSCKTFGNSKRLQELYLQEVQILEKLKEAVDDANECLKYPSTTEYISYEHCIEEINLLSRNLITVRRRIHQLENPTKLTRKLNVQTRERK